MMGISVQPHVLTDLTTNLLHSETLSYTGGLLITIVVITKKGKHFCLTLTLCLFKLALYLALKQTDSGILS